MFYVCCCLIIVSKFLLHYYKILTKFPFTDNLEQHQPIINHESTGGTFAQPSTVINVTNSPLPTPVNNTSVDVTQTQNNNGYISLPIPICKPRPSAKPQRTRALSQVVSQPDLPMVRNDQIDMYFLFASLSN